MTEESKVYIVQDNGKHSYVKAREFGKLEVLLPSKFQIQLSSEESSIYLEEKLRDFNSKDCILATGDPAAIVLACAWAAYYNDGMVDLLKYDRESGEYYKITMELP